MTLHINLLPYREARRLRAVQRIFAAWGGVLLLGLVLIAVVSTLIDNRIAEQKASQSQNKKILAKLDERLGEIKDIESRTKLVMDRLKIIDTLSRQRDLPVQLLATIGEALPEKMWLTEIATQQTRLTIVGNTLSNAMVADFMRRLDRSPHVTNVTLINIAQYKGKRGEILSQPLRTFHLAATIVIPQPPEETGKRPKAPPHKKEEH